MIGVRLVAFHTRKAMGDKKYRRPQDLFPLDVDKEYQNQRRKKMKRINVIKG
jgi:hypothetical protein